jgi:hypothetical protein
MSLAIDSLVTDLMFQSGDALDPEVLVEVLGGQEELAKRQVVDPDMQDPRFEMELSPSIPFRRRGERRLMIIDDSVAPMRKDPQTETKISLDLREAREKLIEVCARTPVRLGRLFALGGWGDAVLVVRNLRDLRAICLLSWALDPSLDIDGRRRAAPLGQSEFEEKLLSYDKRLDELDDESIRECLAGANVEEKDGLIIVDVLAEDGSWDVTKSLELEQAVAAIDRFSAIVGARSVGVANVRTPAPAAEDSGPIEAETATSMQIRRAPVEALKPLRTVHLGDSLLVVFPPERFDLEVAAHLGKKDWESILRSDDSIQGREKDQIYQEGADFVAGVEFLSEVFLGGKPLDKAQFDAGATTGATGVKSMEVHFPRFGPVLLICRPDGSRFVSSRLSGAEEIAGAI